MASNLREQSVPPRSGSAPIQISETEASSLVLDSYVCHILTHQCLNCGNGERFSSIFEVYTHPIHTRQSRFTKLLPLFGVKLNHSLAISYFELPNKPIPFCSDCIDQLPAKASLTVVPQSSRQAWADTLQRKYASAPSEPKKTTPTVDML